ncbi:MAG: arginase [Alphaproteobacteria bacterium]
MWVRTLEPALGTGTVTILGAGWGRGAQDRACRSGPGALRQAGLVAWLEERGIPAHWQETVAVRGEVPGSLMVETVAGLCRQLAQRVEDLVAGDAFFAVLGGDHSCAVGTWSGAARAVGTGGALGLIWVDAHMDSHVPETSPSGALHGMPVACLLGFGAPPLTAVGTPGAAISPHNVCLIGVRSFEAEEAALLQRLGVRVFVMEEVMDRGLQCVFEEALEIVRNGTVGFGLSIDLDALDPMDAPGVGSPVPGGLRARDLVRALQRVSRVRGFVGIEIAEFNPDQDHNGVTGLIVRNLLTAAIPPEGAP